MAEQLTSFSSLLCHQCFDNTVQILISQDMEDSFSSKPEYGKTLFDLLAAPLLLLFTF